MSIKLKGGTSGFALPTVLISSIILMMVLLSGLTATSSVSRSIKNQYYDQIAKEASESGLALATACINKNNDTVTWSNVNPLRPGSNCNGTFTGTSCTATTCFVLDAPQIRSTFTVPFPDTDAYGGYKLSASGSVSMLRTSGAVSDRILAHSTGGLNGYVNNPEIGGGAGFEENGHIGFLKTADGYLYGFGDNTNNQINDDADATIERAFKMELPTDIIRVKQVITSGQGASIMCIIGQNDQLWCRGRPGGGAAEPGLMQNTSGWQKFVIPSKPGIAIESASLQGQGGDTLCAITAESEMYCAGDNYFYGGDYGLLGSTSVLNPVSIGAAVKFSTRSDYKSSFTQDRFTCGITNGDDAYCVANNSSGSLGNNSLVTPAPGTTVRYPLPSGRKVAMIASNYHAWGSLVLHFLATDGTIWGSGKNANGELGDGTSTQRQTPVQFGSRSDYVSMFSGPDHFCGITSAGDVYCAGDNTHGQIGSGVACSATNISVPTKFIMPAPEKAVTALTAQNKNSPYATIIQTQTGNVYSAGDNTYGRFGVGTASACVSTPVKMQIPSGGKARSLSTTDAYSTYIMSTSGKPYSSGRNNLGQLGDGTTTQRTLPQAVILPRMTLKY